MSMYFGRYYEIEFAALSRAALYSISQPVQLQKFSRYGKPQSHSPAAGSLVVALPYVFEECGVASGKITEAKAQELKERMNNRESRQKGGCGMQ